MTISIQLYVQCVITLEKILVIEFYFLFILHKPSQ
jgi:hypothetical protein